MSIISLAYSPSSRFTFRGGGGYAYVYIYINFVFVRARTRIMAEIVGKSVLVIIRLKELAGVKRYDLMSSFQTKSLRAFVASIRLQDSTTGPEKKSLGMY